MYEITDAQGNILATLRRTAAQSAAWSVARQHSMALDCRVWVRRAGKVLGSLHARSY